MFCFSPLWFFMIRNNITKEELKNKLSLENIDFLFDKPSSSLNFSVIDKICGCFSIPLNDVITYVPTETEYAQEVLQVKYIYSTEKLHNDGIEEIKRNYFNTLTEEQKMATILANHLHNEDYREFWEEEKYWLLDNWLEEIHAGLLCMGTELVQQGYNYKQIDEILSIIGNRLR